MNYRKNIQCFFPDAFLWLPLSLFPLIQHLLPLLHLHVMAVFSHVHATLQPAVSDCPIRWIDGWSVRHALFFWCFGVVFSSCPNALLAFLGSGPKGRCPVEHSGGISRCPSFRPSILPSFCPPPVSHQGLKFAPPAIKLALQASNQPSRPQISLPDFKSAPPQLQI